MDCGNHLFAPFVRVTRVMAEAIPDTDIVAGEVHEEEVGTDAVGEVDTVASLVLLLPCVHHETVGICGVVHRVALADCFDRFMSDGSDRLHVILQRQVHIRCAKENGIAKNTALLGLRKCTDEVVLNLAGETTAETEFGERADTVFATSQHVNLLVDSTDSFRFEFGMVLVVVVEIDFVDDGQDVDFEVSVTHQRVRIATSFDSHVRRRVFVISHSYLVTVKTEHAQEMHERGGEPRSLGEEQVKLVTAEREGAEVVNLAVDFRHIFLSELHDAAILSVAALVGPLSGVIAVLGEVEVVHVELIQVCLKQTFYAPMVEHIVTFL